MSAIKEPHFFAAEIREENFDAALGRKIARDAPALREFLSGPMDRKRNSGIISEWDDYLRIFAGVRNESAVGEASVCYLWSPTAAEKIAAAIPDARILVMLRDPAERAFSHYLQGLGSGAIRWSFREQIRRNLQDRSGVLCAHYPFLEFGLYSQQLERYLEKFGRNVWVGLHEDFVSRPLEVYRGICQFLGVSQEFTPDMTQRHREAQVPRVGAIGWLKGSGWWQAAAKMAPSSLRPLIRRALIRRPGTTRMDRVDRQYVVDYYSEDIRKLAGILGRDLDGWLRR